MVKNLHQFSPLNMGLLYSPPLRSTVCSSFLHVRLTDVDVKKYEKKNCEGDKKVTIFSR